MKKFLLVSFLLASLMLIDINSVMAQQILPQGGNSFKTAVKIQPGIYQGGPLAEDESIFYSFSGKAGQLVKVKWDDSVSINLYNENQEILGCETGYNASTGKDENVWLPNSSKSTYTYYIKISNEGFRTVESFVVEFSLSDCYDANSQTDAGDVFEKALTIVPGNYQGCLSVGYIHDYGDDFIDYYKISVRKGETYEFKATPPAKGLIDLKLFSLNREELDYKDSSNDGAIVTMSFTPADNTDIFLAVSGSSSDTSVMFFNYSLSVKTSAPLYKFYSCRDNYCEFTGEFVSKEECQKATAKTCYQGENCDKKCATSILGPTLGLTPGSTLGPTPGPTPQGLFAKLSILFKNLNWYIVGGIITLIILIIFIIIVVAQNKKKKIKPVSPYVPTGTQEANKPVVGYKHPCKYCEKLIPPNSAVCPFCGKANPLGPYRCPKCHEPIEREWQVCPNCNQNLRIVCPNCGKITFFGDHCEDCGARLLVKCPHCSQEQPPLSDNCIRCGKPLKVEKR